MPYHCLIVDDEPIAGEIIASFVERLGDFVVVGNYNSAVEAFGRLQREPVDLLFLDIQMPRLTGLELLRSLPVRPAVILTTAYREYALEGYDLDVVDYLLKPISFDRFMQAIGKFYSRRGGVAAAPVPPAAATGNEPSEALLSVRSDRKTVRLRIAEIQYIESIKDYIRLVTSDDRIITKEQLSALEEQLPKDRFMRIHRSFIVNKAHISAYTAHDVEVGGREIPIGRTYKAAFEQWIV